MITRARSGIKLSVLSISIQWDPLHPFTDSCKCLCAGAFSLLNSYGIWEQFFKTGSSIWGLHLHGKWLSSLHSSSKKEVLGGSNYKDKQENISIRQIIWRSTFSLINFLPYLSLLFCWRMLFGIKIQGGYEKNIKANNQKIQIMWHVIDHLLYTQATWIWEIKRKNKKLEKQEICSMYAPEQWLSDFLLTYPSKNFEKLYALFHV